MLSRKKDTTCSNRTRFGLGSKMILYILLPLLVILVLVGGIVIRRTSSAVNALKMSEIGPRPMLPPSLLMTFSIHFSPARKSR